MFVGTQACWVDADEVQALIEASRILTVGNTGKRANAVAGRYSDGRLDRARGRNQRNEARPT